MRAPPGDVIKTHRELIYMAILSPARDYTKSTSRPAQLPKNEMLKHFIIKINIKNQAREIGLDLDIMYLCWL